MNMYFISGTTMTHISEISLLAYVYSHAYVYIYVNDIY